MEYRILGRTGLKISLLGIGSWQLSGPLTLEGHADGFPDPGRDKVIDLIRACGELGINLIDSAELYGDGEGERRVGEAIRGKREHWVISTKFGMQRGADGQRIADTRSCVIRPSLVGSLRRLRTDYVDIYLYHAPPSPEFISEGRDVLEELRKEGKIRFYGISTNNFKVFRQLVDGKSADVVMLSQSLLTHPSRLLALAKEHKLGVMLRGALEGGRLSGSYFRRQPEFSNEDIRKQAFQAINLQEYSVYEQFVPKGASMSAFALRYLVDFDTTHTIILGGRSIEHYRSAMKALELPPLNLETRRALRRVRNKLTGRFLPRSILRHVYGKMIQMARRA